jgi:hypothetical protein
MPSTQLDIILNAKNSTASVFAAVTKALSGMGNLLGGMQGKLAAALAPAAIFEMVRRTAEEVERIGKAATAAGASIAEMSELAFSGRKSDIEASEMASGLRAFSRIVAEAKSGAKEAASVFSAMNVSIESGNTVDILRETADAFAGYKDGAEKTALALKLFGKSGDEWLSWLNRGGAAMNTDAQAARAFGVAVDSQLVKTVEDFNDAWKQSQESARGFGYALTREIGPSITSVLRSFTGENSPSIIAQEISTDAVNIIGAFTKISSTFIIGLKTGAELLGTIIKEVSQQVYFFFGWDKDVMVGSAKEMVDQLVSISKQGGESLDSIFGPEESQKQLAEKAKAPTNTFTDQTLKSMRDYTASVNAAKRAETEWHNAKMLLRTDITNLERDQRERLAASSMVEVIKRERGELILEIQTLEDRARVLQENLDALPTGSDSLERQVVLNTQLRDIETEKNAAVARELQLRTQQDAQQARMEQPSLTNFHDQMMGQIQRVKNEWVSASYQMASVLTNTVTSAVQGVANALTSVIMGTQSAAQAFSQFALSMATQFISSVLQMVLMATVAIPILTSLGILSGGATVSAGLATTTAAMSAGSSLSASMVSRAGGGIIPGPASDRDNRLAMVATGEYVARAAAVSYYGAELFEALNSMRVPRNVMDGWKVPVRSMPRVAFAEGGLVSGMAQSVNVAPAAVHVAVLNNRAELAEFLQSRAGQKYVVDAVKGARSEIGIRS